MRLLFLLLLTSSYGISVVKADEDFADIVGAAVAGVAVDQTAGRAIDRVVYKVSKSDMKMPRWLDGILDMLAIMLMGLMIIFIGASFAEAPLQTTAFIASQYASSCSRNS